MKHIVFILPSLASGGSERVFSIFANFLDSSGYQVSIITMKSDRQVYPIHDSIHLLHLRIPQGSAAKKLICSFHELDQTLSKLKPDLIIDPNYYRYSTLIAKKKRIPIILSYRNDPGLSRNLPRILYRNVLYGMADYSFFQTAEIENYFVRAVKGKCCVLYNPLSPDIPQPFTGQRRKVFAVVGRLEAQKNIPLTLQAFAAFLQRHPDYALEIYGAGSLLDSLQRQTAASGISDAVTFAGFVPDVLQRIQDCTGFLSGANYEGLSNSMLEAMALGLPVIVTDCTGGSAREFIRNEKNGMLIPCGDPTAMTAAMCRIAEDPGFAQQLSRNGAIVRDQLSIEKIGKQLIAIIDTVFQAGSAYRR